MKAILSYVLLVLVVASVAVQAQAPAGGEFRVSNATAVGDIRPDITADASGAFVVSWTDGSAHAFVSARRYDPRGMPRGSQFTVGSTDGYHPEHAAATDDRGRTMVVWERRDDFTVRIWGRVFGSAGAAVGSEFLVSDPTAFVGTPAIAAARGGNFVVAWTDISIGYGAVVARRFGAAGNPVGSQFMVNTSTTRGHFDPSVAADESGGFTVAWTTNRTGYTDMLGRRFDATGQPSGVEFPVNSYTTGHQDFPRIVVGDRGEFVVVWLDRRQFPGPDNIVGRRFEGAGTPVGAEFQVGATPGGFYLYPPSVASDRAGNFTVAWELSDGDSNGVFARRFTATGLPRGAQFRINTTTTSDQADPQVAVDVSGNLFAAWQSDQNGLMPEIYGQRFGGLVPAGLAVAGEGNGVLEVGDTFTLRPSWRNVSGAPQSFQGHASEPQMPPTGLVLALSTDADYGTVADGAVGTCTSLCFSGLLTGTRPAGHVDGSFLETIVPDVQGQARRRLLHVGGSFDDVPRTSPFYRFVETMLHQGVSAGCGAASFCPSSATPREQIAVMGLLGKEGAGYQPPACGVIPRFLDVPASSPFCRWIEELARRNVVGGCGGGNYCPSAPVTREQLCVIILRLLDPTYTPPACTTPMFADVPAASPFCPWIEEMARRGVAGGCGNGNFCPSLPVTREQVSVFVTVAFGLTLYGP